MAPVDAIWRLFDAATGKNKRHEPIISSLAAALISILFTSLYVAPFYLSPRTRPSRTLNRDAPSVIRARIRAVSATVTFTSLVTLYLLHEESQLSWEASFHQLGIWPLSPVAALQPLLLTVVLYLGPLYHDIYLHGCLSPVANLWSDLTTSLSSSIGYRNYIAGPITEELLFRSSIIPIHLLSPLVTSPYKLVFISPLYFGIAHLHHFYEFRLSYPDTSLTPAILRSVLQFGYTTVFGWYAAYVYLRSGSLLAVVLIHVFCNYMGLPKLWGKVKLSHSGVRSYNVKRTSSAIRSKDDVELDTSSRKLNETSNTTTIPSSSIDPEVLHTWIYYIILLVGVYGFTQLLVPWTSFPHFALAEFSKTKSPTKSRWA